MSVAQGSYLPSISKVPVSSYGYNLKSDSQNQPVHKPIYYGDTSPVDVYRDPVSSYQIKNANSPDSRLASDYVKISPVVKFTGEPMVQAVHNPYEANTSGLTQEIEPKPEKELSSTSYLGAGAISDDSFIVVDEDVDVDDPFEPEAEVDLEIDFLPSVNPLSHVSGVQHSHPVQTNFVSQSLELLPPSFLEGVRLQRQFEDQIADLREDSIIQDLELKKSNNNHKRENIQEIFPQSKEAIFTDASLNRDKILAYNIYKNQWTTSGDKKLVQDPSQALHDYYRKYNLVDERQTVRDHNTFDIDISGPYQPERDNQVKKYS